MDSSRDLRRECCAFTRYLCGLEASDYVVERYAAAHREPAAFAPSSRFDRWLLTVARRVPWLTRVADSSSRLLMPESVLRLKLLLLLAILETSPQVHLHTAGPFPAASPFIVCVKLAASATLGVVLGVLGLALFVPLYAVAIVVDRCT